MTFVKLRNASVKYTHALALIAALLINTKSPAQSANPPSHLQSLLRHALAQDPKVLESKANISIAESQTGISKAGHYPVLSIVNTQVLSQNHKNAENHVRSRPTLKGQVNLFSWGAVQNSVERDKHKEDFFKYKHEETKEQIGKNIVELYLSALRAKEIIAIHNRSLLRYRKIVQNIRTIVEYDKGRMFELSEAESRLFQTESVIEQQSRILQLTLSRLNRYAAKPLTEEHLEDPFARINPDRFVGNYKNPDLAQNPTIQAQQKELESTQADLKATKAKRLPALNLEGEVYNKGYNVFLGVSWNIFDLAASRAVDQSRFTEQAAHAKLLEVLLELQEQARSAEIDLKQNARRLKITEKQISAQKKVVQSTELQFTIAQRSLLNVLNAHKELTDIEVEQVDIQNDFRLAALNYLVSQARVAEWAGARTFNF